MVLSFLLVPLQFYIFWLNIWPHVRCKIGIQLYLFAEDYPVFAMGKFILFVATECHLNLISILGNILMLCALPPQGKIKLNPPAFWFLEVMHVI